MNILLTGGSGFIGKNILESFLSQKYTILAPAHKELELLDEIAVREFFCRNNIDVVIHGAVKAGHRFASDTSHQLYNNTKMFFNLVRNSGQFRKMIFLGSGLTYDIRYYIPKMKEEYFDTHVPADEGGFSKYIIAKYIEKSDNITELRLFGIFGKYEEYAIRFISNSICKTLFDLPITIKQNRRFDYIYINDLMPVIDYFIQHNPKHKAYNVTPDYSAELYTLAEEVKRISGKDLPISIAQIGTGPEYSGDNSRLREEIKGLKFTFPDESIKELYEWYSNNKHFINRELLLFDK